MDTEAGDYRRKARQYAVYGVKSNFNDQCKHREVTSRNASVSPRLLCNAVAKFAKHPVFLGASL